MAQAALPGFRDFYPEQFAERAYITRVWREVAHRFAFVEYDGPPLEALDLYTKKSGDEIVGQLYEFEDKGGRRVALRPEMTPTLARMVGVKANALRKHTRGFSVPQLLRYESRQRWRVREHFQLHADSNGEAAVTAAADLPRGEREALEFLNTGIVLNWARAELVSDGSCRKIMKAAVIVFPVLNRERDMARTPQLVSGRAPAEDLVGGSHALAECRQKIQRSVRSPLQERHQLIAIEDKKIGILEHLRGCGPRAAVKERELAEDVGREANQRGLHVGEDAVEIESEPQRHSETSCPPGLSSSRADRRAARRSDSNREAHALSLQRRTRVQQGSATEREARGRRFRPPSRAIDSEDIWTGGGRRASGEGTPASSAPVIGARRSTRTQDMASLEEHYMQI